MKKLILNTLFISLISINAYALGPNDIRIQQRDPTNAATLFRDMPFPAGGANGMVVMDGATILPAVATFDGGITYNGTSLTTSNIPQANVNGLVSALAAKADGSSLSPVATSGAYADLTGKPSIPAAQVNADWNAVSGIAQILNKPTIPSIVSPTFNNPSRSLNTAFQISTTQNAQVSYSVDVTATMSLLAGQSGTVILEYADDSGMTTNVKTVSRATNSNSGALTIGINLVQGGASNLSGMIPAGKYVRIRTVNNAGTPTFSMTNSQEVLV